MYVKVFRSIFDGSLYGQFEPTVVFLAMLVLAEREGIVDMTMPAIAARCGYPLDVVERGISELEKPDAESRTPDDEGRRIVRLEEGRSWGWRITNYEKYDKIRSSEERREYFRRKKAEYRAKAKVVHNVHQASTQSTSSSSSSTSTSESKKLDRAATQPDLEGFQDFQAIFPKRAGSHRWQDAKKHWNARLREGYTAEQMIEGARRYQAFIKATDKERTEFVSQGASFLGTAKLFLEPWDPPATKAQIQQDKTVDAGLEWLQRAD